ncbi:hypothetical protein GR254_20580, partial [Mycobacterium tuberculosis]|nr:hypothetical protein [Mycobacterium tuberculosis]
PADHALSVVLLALGAMVSWTTNVAEISPAVATLGRPKTHPRPRRRSLLRPVTITRLRVARCSREFYRTDSVSSH